MRAQGGWCCHRACIALPPTRPSTHPPLQRRGACSATHPPRVAAVLQEGKEIHFKVPHIPGGCTWGGVGWGVGGGVGWCVCVCVCVVVVCVCGGGGGRVWSSFPSLASPVKADPAAHQVNTWNQPVQQGKGVVVPADTAHSPQPAQRSAAEGRPGRPPTALCLWRGVGMYPNQFRSSRRSQPLTRLTRETTPPLDGRRRAAWAAGPLRPPPRRRGPAQARPKPGRGPRRWGRPAGRQRA